MLRSSRNRLRAVLLDHVRHGDHADTAVRRDAKYSGVLPCFGQLRRAASLRSPAISVWPLINACVSAAQLRVSALPPSGRCPAAPESLSRPRHAMPSSSRLLAESPSPADARSGCSSAHAIASSSISPTPAAGTMSVTRGSPLVIVPVLSSATMLHAPRFLQRRRRLEQDAVLRAHARCRP